ncbi:MAG: iron-containing alcohol dehydrogenase [Gemmatimonadota bacterium]|nr:iron-containing alcohol dehydrogenase [Gemmatimonadota bacterium]
MEFSFPTRIIFGADTLNQLPELVTEHGMRHPMIVTDPGLVKAGLINQVTAALTNFSVFDCVAPNPTEDNIFDGVRHYIRKGCDGIVGVGGGSSLDAGKIIGLMTTHDRPLADYDDNTSGDRLIGPNIPPIIAIPTTAGTGSEVGRSGVITLKETDRKTVIFSPHLMPSVALCDPKLTRRLPKHITAATGVDAMTHNIEAYLAKGFHPVCDGIALHGVALVYRYLPTAVWNGEKDIDARGQMMIAASMGATAFQKGLGATHSLAHPLSTVAGVPHGLANAILLPHVLRFNAESVPERLRDIGIAMGLDIISQSSQEAASTTIDAIDRFLRNIGIPTHLSETGVDPDILPTLVSKALEDGCHLLNPRPCTANDFRLLYEEAM